METNEEIVAMIQAGRTDLYLELWYRIKGMVASEAYSRLMIAKGFDRGGTYGSVDIEDLTQAGYIAMYNAVQSYDPERAKFTTYLRYFLQSAFNEAQGLRTSKRDPLDNSFSLDRPLDEDSDETFCDTIPGADRWQGVDEKIFTDQLHDAIEKALREIPERRAEVVRRTVLENQTLNEVGKAIGVSVDRVRVIRNEGLKALKNNRGLRQFLQDEINYYFMVSPKTFNTTHESATEVLALRRMRLEQRYLKGYAGCDDSPTDNLKNIS